MKLSPIQDSGPVDSLVNVCLHKLYSSEKTLAHTSLSKKNTL